MLMWVPRVRSWIYLVTNEARQFAYSVVGFHGSGIVTYGEALSAVFLEGYVIILIQIGTSL